MLFDREIMDELICGDDWDGEYEIVLHEVYDVSRWTVTYKFVFKVVKTGKYYRVYYDQGATEMQEDTDTWGWAAKGDKVECKEVQKVEKLVTVYE